MRASRCSIHLLGSLLLAHAGVEAAERYGVAFASFAPLDTDIFIAHPDGSGARPLASHPELDSNASFSRDGKWILFTSRRNGSADIYRMRSDGSALERLIDHPAYDDQAALAPDGRRLAFVSSRGGQADIWILDLASKRLTNLTRHPAGDFRPAWSPDGRWIAFSSDRDSKQSRTLGGFTVAQNTELYLMRADGRETRRLTSDGAFVGSPAFSPDGGRLAFFESSMAEYDRMVAPRRLRATTQIGSLDLASGERRVLTGGPGEKWSPRWLDANRIAFASGGPEGGIEATAGRPGVRGEFRNPSWSPDGRSVVFHRDVRADWPPHDAWPTRDSRFALVRTGVFPSYSPTGKRLVCNDNTAGILHNNITIMNADGSQRARLFGAADASALAPAWARHEDWIAFGFGRFFQNTLGAATADIAVVRADGSGLRVLTKGGANYGFPSWSPDGRSIVFREASGSVNRLHVLDVASGSMRVLLEGRAHYNFPAWSPHGDRIAFTSDHEGDYEIYSIRPDGSGLERLTHAPGNDAHPRWSADGRWIAFATTREGFKDEALLNPFNPQPQGEIAVMRSDGSDVRLLTDNQFEEGTPSFADGG